MNEITIKLLLYAFLSLLIAGYSSAQKSVSATWAISAGGNNNDYARSVATGPAGNVYIAGSFGSAGINFGDTTLLNYGGYATDMYLVKFDVMGNLLWATSTGGNNNNVADPSVAVDPDGNAFVTGCFGYISSISFDSTILTSNGADDIYIVKYDPDGNVLWATSAGGYSNDRPRSISADAAGNVYLTGYFFSGSISFGSITLTSNGSGDIFVVKYDGSGNVLWAKNAGGDDDDWANSVTTGPGGDIFVAGFYKSSIIYFDSITQSANNGNTDLYLVKYNASGDVLWAESTGGSELDVAQSVATDADGNVYMAGYYKSSSISFGNTTLANNGYGDICLVKYDASGSVIWAEGAGGSETDNVNSVCTDAEGNIYMAGYFDSNSLNFGSITLTNSGDDDMFLVKYNNAGNVLWAERAGSFDMDKAQSVTTNIAGDIFVAGYFSSNHISFGNTTLINNGGYDMFLVKYETLTGTDFVHNNQPKFVLYQNIPNPARNRTAISFYLPKTSKIELSIYNITGKQIEILERGIKSSGTHTAFFNSESLPAGIYFYKLEIEENVLVKMMIVQQ